MSRPAPVVPPGPGDRGRPGDTVPAAKRSVTARRGRIPKVLAGVAGVVVLAGIGWFVFQAIGGKSGGADTADAAVQQLVDAANHKDIAGALAALNPDEVDELGDVLATVEDQAQKSGAAPKDDALSAFDVKIADVQLSDDELADDVVKVEIEDGHGAFDYRANKVATRVRPLAPESESATIDRDDLVVEGADHVDDTNLRDGKKIDPFVMTVKRNGGWYVSPEYTAMQYWVEINDLPDPDFDSDLPDDLQGASSPKEALEGFAASLDSMDVDDWMQYVSENERRVLWAYKDAIEEVIERNGYEHAFSFGVDDTEVTEKSLSGGAKALTVTRASGTARGSADDQEIDWRYDGRCLTTESDGDDAKTCADRRAEFADVPYRPATALWQVMGSNGTVVAVKQDGSWVISPLASLARTLKAQVSSASTEELYAWIGVPQLAPATAKLTLGKRMTGTFNKGGYAVFDVTLSKGTNYVYQRDKAGNGNENCQFESDDDDCWEFWDQIMGAEDTGILGGNDGGTDTFSADESGAARIVVFGKPGSRYSFLFAEVPTKSMPASGEVEGTLTKDEPAVAYGFKPGETGTWSIEDSVGGASIDVRDASGNYVDVGYEELQAGSTYTVAVSGEPGTDYDVSITKAAASIDGGSSQSGFLNGGESQMFSFDNSGSHPVTVTLEPDDYSVDFDLFFQSDGTGSCSNRTAASSSAGGSLSLPGGCSGTLTVEAYSGDSSYTLSVQD